MAFHNKGLNQVSGIYIVMLTQPTYARKTAVYSLIQ